MNYEQWLKDFLKKLGDGDWEWDLPDDDENIAVFTKAWRDEQLDKIAEKFVRWVLRGIDHTHHHRYDPPWDSSGNVDSQKTDSLTLVTRYSTLSEWFEDALTGHSQASYVSGSGLNWMTYGDEFGDDIEEAIFYVFAERVTSIYQVERGDLFFDKIIDVCCDNLPDLEGLMVLSIGKHRTFDIWKKYEMLVREKIAEEHRQAEIRRQQLIVMREQVKQFWELHFSEYNIVKIEAPQFDEEKVGERLIELLMDADPELVKGIATVGLPGKFSNSVTYQIELIAKSALD
jgi:hypothetical protein